MPETTPLIKAALNLRVGVGFDVYIRAMVDTRKSVNTTPNKKIAKHKSHVKLYSEIFC